MDILTAYRTKARDIIDRIQADLENLPEGPEKERLQNALEELERAVNNP